MAITRTDRSVLADLLSPPPAMTFDSLAPRLRDGALRTMLTLQIRAGTFLSVAENERQRLEKLVELAQLARMAGTQLQHFTGELQTLIDRMAAVNRKIQ